MDWIKLLQDAINYMDENLTEKINYEDVAARVYMSCYNFHRTFSLMAGITANEYIKNRRLSKAGEELQLTDASVTDIAYKYGYETPESFSKAFSRFHGVTPKQAKRKGTQLRMFNPLVIKITLEGGSIMDYRIEHKESVRFIARTRAFSNELSVDSNGKSIPEFWQECNEKKLVEQIRNLRPDGKKDLYGLCQPTLKSQETFDYGIGVILDSETEQDNIDELLKQGYNIWTTEPTDYVVFKCKGENGDCISDTWSRYYKEFLPQSGYEQSEKIDYEIYFERGEQGLFCELWIPVDKK